MKIENSFYNNLVNTPPNQCPTCGYSGRLIRPPQPEQQLYRCSKCANLWTRQVITRTIQQVVIITYPPGTTWPQESSG